MFRETIHHPGGVTHGHANERHAVSILTRAVRRGYAVEATPSGGALITWTRATFGPTADGTIRADRSISLEPFTPVGAISPTTRADLALIGGDPHAHYAEQDGRRVISGLVWRIPAFTTARLRARSLITEDEAGRVRLTLTARLGLLAQAHRTRTTEPAGWHRPSAATPYGSAGLNRPGRRAGMLHDGGSAALCACGGLAGYGSDRAEARRLTAAHRREVTTRFITEHLAAPLATA
ncbi:hypothetical protein [Streptomyces sp. NPDC057250]|uniref:hypothetical protein n=1 Tax=Streptomyces sp. NPDC057250 TaxID=3346068 RepID=UPI0036391740